MQRILISIVGFLLLLSVGNSALAYRPYVSTNAAVNSPQNRTLEAGFFSYAKEGSEATLTTPSLDLSYSLINRLDIGVTSSLQIYTESEARNVELSNTSVYFDYQIRNGILQKKTGLSIMTEVTLLLPTTIKGERDLGLVAIIAASEEFFNFKYHVNAGVTFDQADFNPGFLWGVIVEYPFFESFRIGIEFAGAAIDTQLPNNQGGLGIIWKLGVVSVDVGARMGLSDAANDWEITTGITLSF